MNRVLLFLNVAAAGSILATNSAALLTAISPYGSKSSGPAAPAVHEAQAVAPVRTTAAATPSRVTVSGFVAPTAARQDSLAVTTASLP